MNNLEPITRKEHFYGRMAGNEKAVKLEPVTREEMFLEDAIEAIESGGPGGGAVSSVNGKTGAVVLVPSDIEAEPKKLTVTVTESGGVYTADKTYAEIVSAYESSREIVVVFDDKRFGLLETDGVDFMFGSVASSTIYSLLSRPQGWVYAVYNIQMKPTIVTDLSSTSITIAAADNTEYSYGELTALTVSSFPASGTFWIVFLSGATATTVTGIDNFVPEANKRYKITVEDGYATFDAWSTT